MSATVHRTLNRQPPITPCVAPDFARRDPSSLRPHVTRSTTIGAQEFRRFRMRRSAITGRRWRTLAGRRSVRRRSQHIPRSEGMFVGSPFAAGEIRASRPGRRCGFHVLLDAPLPEPQGLLGEPSRAVGRVVVHHVGIGRIGGADPGVKGRPRLVRGRRDLNVPRGLNDSPITNGEIEVAAAEETQSVLVGAEAVIVVSATNTGTGRGATLGSSQDRSTCS